MQQREKVVRIGTVDRRSVFCSIEYKVDGDKRTLSISGVHGPWGNGDCFGSCGQIYETATEVNSFAPGWDAETRDRFVEIWKIWHLNDMRAGCEHQRKAGWNKRPIDPTKSTGIYGKHFNGQQSASWNMLVWVTRKEHPEGLLSHPCPECGYKYGSAWLYEPLPDDIVSWLGQLPETDKKPAWI